MKTIKFVGNDTQHKQFAAALRKNVNDYFKEKGISTKGKLPLTIQTISMLAMYIVPFVLLMTLPFPGWVSALFTIIMGVGMAGIGMCVMHDAVHGSFSSREWVNKLFGASMYLLGSNVLNWKMQHNIIHHAYTNVEGLDEDIESKGPIRLSDHAPLKKIHRFQYIHAFFFYGLLTLSKLVRDFTQMIKYNKIGLTKHYKLSHAKEYTKMVLTKLAYIFVLIGLPLLFTSFTWWQVLIGFCIMHWTAGIILSIIFQMAHVVEGVEQHLPAENGIIQCEWAVHEMRTTANFAPNNRLLNWYVGGLNFQIEHHLFPQICHIHYRKIAPIVEKTAREYGIVYHLKPTFRNALRSHVRRLKELGRPVPVVAG
jgi:linoleoyl-CoA desaturase